MEDEVLYRNRRTDRHTDMHTHKHTHKFMYVCMYNAVIVLPVSNILLS